MPNPNQSAVVYLMFLSGVLFLGLNWCAFAFTAPAPKGSKRRGYAFLLLAFLALAVQQQYRALLALDFPSATAGKILFGGFLVPVFALSLVYYRFKVNRDARRRTTDSAPPANPPQSPP
jgi:hypothetical protein